METAKDHHKREVVVRALRPFGTTIFTEMTGLANRFGAVNLSQGSPDFDDDLESCRMLPERAGVAAIPCSLFWKDRSQGRELVRFCFCKKDETLKEGIQRLRRWLKSG